MQKSGSAWYFQLTNDLLIAAGKSDASYIRDKFKLGNILGKRNFMLKKPYKSKLSYLLFTKLLIPHFLGYSYVIKTHRGPRKIILILMKLNIIRAAYIYRDPRDVIVSVRDAGKKARDLGLSNEFVKYFTIEKATEYVKGLMHVWRGWMNCKFAITTRYEDLLLNPVSELRKLAGFFHLDVSEEKLIEIVKKYDTAKLDQKQQRMLHLNKGVSNRYKSEMNHKQIEECNSMFNNILKQMGYD